MGRLLAVHACMVCNYYIEGPLHHGGSGISPLFLRNHYALAVCRTCHNLVSVMVANTDQQTQDALTAARRDLVQMEADAVIGDKRAIDLLPLYREALDLFDDEILAETSVCSVCGSVDLNVYDDLTGLQFDDQNAWLHCPRCEEGRLLIETSGYWDEALTD